MKICQLLIIAAIVLIALKQKNGLRDTLLLLAFFFSFCLINKEGLSEEDDDDDDDDSEIPEVIISIPPSADTIKSDSLVTPGTQEDYDSEKTLSFSVSPSVTWTYTGKLGDNNTTMTVKKQRNPPKLSCNLDLVDCYTNVEAGTWWICIVAFGFSLLWLLPLALKTHTPSDYDWARDGGDRLSAAMLVVGSGFQTITPDNLPITNKKKKVTRILFFIGTATCLIYLIVVSYSSKDTNGCIKDTPLPFFNSIIMEHEERTPGTVRLRDQPMPTPTPSPTPTPTPTPTPSGNGKSCDDCWNESEAADRHFYCLMDEKICSANSEATCIEGDPSSPMKWCGSPPQNVGGVYSGEDEPQNIDDVFICCDNSDSCACSDINNYAEQCRNLSLNGDDGYNDSWNKTGKLNVGGDKFSQEETAEKSYLEKCCAPVVKCTEASFSCAPGSTPKEEATCSYSPCSQEDFQSSSPSPSPPTSTTCCTVD